MLPVLLLGYFFREIGDFFRNILLIDMGSGLVGRIALGGAAVNLALNYLLISGPFAMGIWGAVASTTLTWGLYCAVCWIAAWRAHAVKFSFWPLARLAAFSTAILAGQSYLRAGNPYVQLATDAAWLAAFAAGSAMIYLQADHRREAIALAQGAMQTGRDWMRMRLPGEP